MSIYVYGEHIVFASSMLDAKKVLTDVYGHSEESIEKVRQIMNLPLVIKKAPRLIVTTTTHNKFH